jgi:hypothetical protein
MAPQRRLLGLACSTSNPIAPTAKHEPAQGLATETLSEPRHWSGPYFNTQHLLPGIEPPKDDQGALHRT